MFGDGFELSTIFRTAPDGLTRMIVRSSSLARLLAKQGKEKEARGMLAEIYGWFSEGFDTADLKDAKALLEELST